VRHKIFLVATPIFAVSALSGFVTFEPGPLAQAVAFRAFGAETNFHPVSSVGRFSECISTA
jgi:hypothetical protein